MTELDFGPLNRLIGAWEGANGIDIAPEPSGSENNPYFERLVFEAVGDVTNAESQLLTAIRYHQSVSRKSDQQVFHDQIGYWIWDRQNQIVMHSFCIPRGVSVLAGGVFNGSENQQASIELKLTAHCDHADWGIAQSPYLGDNAKTLAFEQKLTLDMETLSYSQTTLLEIYSKRFEHTDCNELKKVS